MSSQHIAEINDFAILEAGDGDRDPLLYDLVFGVHVINRPFDSSLAVGVAQSKHDGYVNFVCLIHVISRMPTQQVRQSGRQSDTQYSSSTLGYSNRMQGLDL
ncbi:hypothetical protein D3C73_1499970 [compost metagenome]